MSYQAAESSVPKRRFAHRWNPRRLAFRGIRGSGNLGGAFLSVLFLLRLESLMERSMTTKASFTPEEWSRVLASPMVAGMAITAADPSGLWGIIKEGMAGGWALLHAKQDPNANALVKAVAEDFASGDARSPARERIQMTFKDAQPGDVIEVETREMYELCQEAVRESGRTDLHVRFRGVPLSEAPRSPDPA
jgi:hypothetical protein